MKFNRPYYVLFNTENGDFFAGRDKYDEKCFTKNPHLISYWSFRGNAESYLCPRIFLRGFSVMQVNGFYAS